MYELIFPDDEVVVLPCEMGITGECFQKRLSKIVNDADVLIKNNKNEKDPLADSEDA